MPFERSYFVALAGLPGKVVVGRLWGPTSTHSFYLVMVQAIFMTAIKILKLVQSLCKPYSIILYMVNKLSTRHIKLLSCDLG